MAGITIKSAADKTAFAVGDKVVLTAEAPSGATGFQWKHDGAPVGGTENNLQFDMAADSGGAYTVEAKATDGSTLSGSINLTVASASAPAGTPAEPQPTYHGSFAAWSAVGLAVLGGFLAFFIGPWRHGGMSDTDWTNLAGQLKVAVILGLPATLFGALVLLAGLWMALVEWRGRLVDEPSKPKPANGTGPVRKGAFNGEDVAKVIGAVGSLRGAALAMVVGAILLLGSAWVAQSAAGTGGDAGASSAPVTEAPPTGTAAPGST